MSEENAHGIPKAPFVEKVEDYLGPSLDAESALRKLADFAAKYSFLQDQLKKKKIGLEEKIPELAKTLEGVNFLMKQEEEVEMTYELNDTLWTRATVEPTKNVFLWLGANIMVEYSTEEAKELLAEKLETAKKSLSIVDEDLEYVREQITTMEVNIARVYNWDVKRRRK